MSTTGMLRSLFQVGFDEEQRNGVGGVDDETRVTGLQAAAGEAH